MTQIQAYEDMSKELPDEPEYGRAWRKHASLYGYHDQHTFAAGWNAAKDDMLSAAIESAQSAVANCQLTACSCPSGNGSLRPWPCPVHPPESVNLMKWSNQQASSTDKKHGFTECVFIGDPPSGYESWAQWGATPIKKGVQIMALTKCDHSYPDNAHESEKKVQP